MTRSPATACHMARAPERSANGRLRDIAVQDIHANPSQPRKHFDDASLAALADSIRERGVLQPMIVQPRLVGGYELVAGEGAGTALRSPAQQRSRHSSPSLLTGAVDRAPTPVVGRLGRLRRRSRSGSRCQGNARHLTADPPGHHYREAGQPGRLPISVGATHSHASRRDAAALVLGTADLQVAPDRQRSGVHATAHSTSRLPHWLPMIQACDDEHHASHLGDCQRLTEDDFTHH
jgi:ParB-like nuclease domain